MIFELLKQSCHPNTLDIIKLNKLKDLEYFNWLMEATEQVYLSNNIEPQYCDLFRAFSFDWSNAKVLIIEQDPYITPGLADGLAFSTKNAMITPSLNIMFNELERSYNRRRTNTNLDDWAEQGVLLLNTNLTVEHYKPNSHNKFMWDYFIKHCIEEVIKTINPNLIVLAWGKPAKEFANELEGEDITVLQSVHPVVDARMNANKFVGNNHFYMSNQLLEALDKDPIDWIGKHEVKSMYHCLYEDTCLTNEESAKLNDIYNVIIERV